MKASSNALRIIKQFEGLRLKAYKCSAGVWTIGYGNTFYTDGTKVKQGDAITLDKAELMLRYIVSIFSTKVSELIKTKVNQNQFDALVSFAYNVGTAALAKSTLLRKVNANPCDISIELEFMKWDKAKGQRLPGLTKRRQQESDLYFKPV
jgi:lysozyme